MQEVLQEKYYILTRSGEQKAGINVGKLHGHNKPLVSHQKPEKAAQILAQLPSSIAINQAQLVPNVPIRRGVGRAGLK